MAQRQERRTGGRGDRVDVRDVLGHDDGKASLKMEVDVAVEEPRARVVSPEPDGDVVASTPGVDDVALGRVDVVVVRHARAANDVEGVLDWRMGEHGELVKYRNEDLHRAGGRGGEHQGRWRR